MMIYHAPCSVQTEGRVTHFVASTGTCGTLTGTGAFLKSMNGAVKVLRHRRTAQHRTSLANLPAVACGRAAWPALQVVAAVPIEGHDIPGAPPSRSAPSTGLAIRHWFGDLYALLCRSREACTSGVYVLRLRP
jgi:hypothetical protein